MFVYKLHFLSAILVLQFHMIFLCPWYIEKRRLLCSWITATLIWYIGSYMLLPIDFNGKLEIFLKHFKKNIFFFWFACVSDWTLIIFQVSLLSLKPCQLWFFF